MLDSAVIASCIASRRAYDRIAQHVDVGELSPQGGVWWPYVVKWYESDPSATAIDPAILRERGKRNFDDKHKDMLLSWFDDLPPPLSPENVATELLELRRQQVGLEACQLIQAHPERAVPVIEEWLDLQRATSLTGAQFLKADLDETFEFFDDSNRLPLRPRLLNKRLDGGALPGDFILVFGRPNAGKSLFALNMACGVARDGHEVVYICNEEKKQKIHFRMVCNLCNAPLERVRANPDRAKKLALDRGLGNIHLYEAYGARPEDIKHRLEQHPGAKLLVVDQLRHLEGGGNSLNQRLEANAVAMRNIIGEFGVVGVFVTQAAQHDADGDPPVHLRMADIDNSRTGLPGAADIIIGIGMNSDMERHGTRMVSLPKIKGGDDTPFTVKLHKETSKVGDT